MNDTQRKLSEFHMRRTRALERIERVARPLVATLKDHKLDNTAAELAAALWEFDVLNEELVKFVAGDPDRILGEIFGGALIYE